MTEKDNAKVEIRELIQYILSETNVAYNALYAEVFTEEEYCDAIMNEVQEQLAGWLFKRKNNNNK